MQMTEKCNPVLGFQPLEPPPGFGTVWERGGCGYLLAMNEGDESTGRSTEETDAALQSLDSPCFSL